MSRYRGIIVETPEELALAFTADQRQPRQRVSIEDVVAALAAQCDGARKRDGRGFNRADAQEGGRLAALKQRDMAWSVEDANRAMEIAGRYAKQAAGILGNGHETRTAGIEAALRGGRVQLADDPVENQAPYNYACLSPGGKRVYLWRLTWVADLAGLIRDLRAACRPHGQRKSYMDPKETAEISMNGQRRRYDRCEVDFNGTTQAALLEVCERHGFVIEPAVATAVDDEIDQLRRFERAAWIHRGTRDGEKGVWAVFDLAQKAPDFSAAVKERMRSRFECDPQDDWNWFLRWDAETIPTVRRLAAEFRFAVSDDIRHGKP